MHKTTRRLTAALSAAAILSLGLMGPPASAIAADTLAAPTAQDLAENLAAEVFQGAVAPSECANTPLNDYFAGLAAQVTDEQRSFIVAHLNTLFWVPTYASLFLSRPGDPDYALGPDGQRLQHTFRDLTRFWSDIKSDDIQLVGMHGDVLLDPDRIAASLKVMIRLGAIPPMTADQIANEATSVADFMASQGDLYQSPLWTFGAYSFTGKLNPDPEYSKLPDKIVIGDGTMVAYDDLGLGDVAPSLVLAHEFAHQVQFELGTYDSGPADPAEATRRTELMADAMAVYYGVHKKGLDLNSKRVVNALLTFYDVGDCSFDDPTHHGTPLQRERAAEWGANLEADARPRSLVLPSATVTARFDAALPGIIAGS